MKFRRIVAASIRKNAEMVAPTAAASMPGTPFALLPTKQAQLSAITPGSVCASVAYSTNSSLVIQRRVSTTSFWITGTQLSER
jgi:hypothetical protein